MAHKRPPAHMPPFVDPQALPDDPAAAAIRELSGWWLDCRCSNGHSVEYPLRLMCAELWPANPAIAAVVARLKCRLCGARPARVELLERPGGNPLVGKQPRRVPLHSA